MRFRKLRIAWSVVCGIACVLLIVLWVRSYGWVSQGGGSVTTGKQIKFASTYGRVWVHITDYPSPNRPWHFYETPTIAWKQPLMFVTDSDGVAMPYWLLVAISAVPAALPWLRWRFSLRTLLIATTVIAVVLGLIAWWMR